MLQHMKIECQHSVQNCKKKKKKKHNLIFPSVCNFLMKKIRNQLQRIVVDQTSKMDTYGIYQVSLLFRWMILDLIYDNFYSHVKMQF